MVRRLLKLSNSNSLFIFGARSTGKTTLLTELFKEDNKTLWINLLEEADEEIYGRHPSQLSLEIATKRYHRVIIDEIQKFPKILDIVHLEIEKNPKIQFILTGSSARKLKRGAANLLGGRAFTYSLHPFTYIELGSLFNLPEALKFGTLPKLLEYSAEEDKKLFLKSYIKIYIKEEVLVEQLIRDLEPFRNFLEVAAQTNGKIINYSKIAKEVGVSDNTIKEYYQILEDTLIGFFLPSFHRSIRKQQRVAPKFYLFDPGVKRALDRTLGVDLIPKTFAFGDAFEHFIILEVIRLNDYYQKDFKLSYLRTKDNLEIDLIIERPGLSDLLVEIKSTDMILEDDAKIIKTLFSAWDKKCDAQIWSLDSRPKKIENVSCLFWQDALLLLFENKVQ